MKESIEKGTVLTSDVSRALLFPTALAVFAVVCFIATSLYKSGSILPIQSIPTVMFLSCVSVFWLILSASRYRKIKNSQ